jgi:hypothetical protein
LSGNHHKGCISGILGAISGIRRLSVPKNKKAAHGDMSRLGGGGILIFKKHSTGELKYIIPPCGMSSIFLIFFKKKREKVIGELLVYLVNRLNSL